MNSLLRAFIFCSGFSFTGIIFYLLFQKKINERNTILWLAGLSMILFLSIEPQWIDYIARMVGVDYPPSLVFLVAVLLLFIVVLYQSIQISRLNEKLKELSQQVALGYYQDRALTGKRPVSQEGRNKDELAQ